MNQSDTDKERTELYRDDSRGNPDHSFLFISMNYDGSNVDYVEHKQRQQKNCKKLADELMARGFKLVAGGTDNHLLMINLINRDMTGKEAETLLDEAHITVNKNSIPFDPQNFFKTSGVRMSLNFRR